MTKSSRGGAQTSDFENLVQNGIDFLEKAMSQLDSDPKHSVINFYTAVEIFLKAPLVHDHWTLVVLDRDMNRQKYEAGDFLSVSFEDACARLGAALSKPLKSSAKEAFDRVRKHRNRMVHFYHSGIDGKQRDEIKLEQAQAWFELNRFVTETWREQFKPFASEFRRMERNLIANNHYAQAKYEDLRPKIEGMKKGGKTFEACPACGTNAYLVEEEAPRLYSRHCIVCFHSEKRIQIDCPECGDPDQYAVPYDGFTCDKCGCQVSGESEIFDLLDQNTVRGTKDDLDSDTPANCDECQGYHTVCEYEGGYLCTNCFTFFDSVGKCQWCNDPMTGDTEDTYVTGCEHCDGYAGHHADD
ncbi:hypothetical protein [Ralstonia pseudosolanacearum]|uniref:hypothetical protein n=1 Tax=Ralstonia pseudosolanacearum TaxID=1310165 RepID=UPI0026763E17|nr:hypothetical protein [Ralstonia pseudosolanacearum]MDO3552068.1 hypothetical protein [Ralstonia pseudosolanacearum]